MSKKRVYAFDFDGTLTTRDTLIAFIAFVHGAPSLLLGMFRYSPWLVLMKLGRYPNWKVKQRVFSHFFKGMPLDAFNAHCLRFAHEYQGIVRKQGRDAVLRAQREGAEVVIVSASVDNWVAPFFPGVTVLGTKIEVEKGKLTGSFLTRNCYGQEKVVRLLAHFPDRDSYELIAYGDSRGDKELLEYADCGYYKPFR